VIEILITGASGFVGKHLNKRLEDKGYNVAHLVRKKKGFKNEFIWDFKGELPHDLPACNVIIHLAAYVGFSLEFDIERYNVNTISTIKLSAYAKSCNAYFILASTVGVHGSIYTKIGKDTPLGPDNHYALSKYVAEEVVKTHLDDYSIIRICGIYGIKGPSHMGLNKAITDAVCLKIPPVLNGTGKAKRNYICVSDVALWIMDLLNKYEARKASETKRIYETLYLASPEIMNIKQYLQTIIDVVLPNEEIVMMEGEEASDMIVKPSIAPFRLQTFREYLVSLV